MKKRKVISKKKNKPRRKISKTKRKTTLTVRKRKSIPKARKKPKVARKKATNTVRKKSTRAISKRLAKKKKSASRQEKGIVIEVATREASLKRRFRRHLKLLGFTKGKNGVLEASGSGKDVVRSLHSAQRRDRIAESESFIKDNSANLLKYFASGSDVDPTKIDPVLQRISSNSWETSLFRFASLTWSVPVSNGFGRRIRYLVWDRQNSKLMGLIAIGDPVFNLSARDKLIGWTAEDRGERLVNIMDAYVLGAVPPYNMLLGGKLVASLIRSRDIYDDFAKIYGATTGIISHQEKKARLLAVTTSSSMGRSSVYNRLKLEGTEYFKPIGFTGGWGHFHIPDSLFIELRDYLRDIGHSYADLHKFGQGPNWRLRTTRAALSELGFKDDLLKHGIQREVFISQLADNALSILKTGKGKPNLSSLLSTEEVASLAVKRWMIPRAERRAEYMEWRSEDIQKLLTLKSKVVFLNTVKAI